MKAIVYTYQGEEFRGEIEAPTASFMDETYRFLATIDQEDGTRVYLRTKDIRAVITDRLEDVPAADDPPSFGAAPQPSGPPEASSAPEGT